MGKNLRIVQTSHDDLPPRIADGAPVFFWSCLGLILGKTSRQKKQLRKEESIAPGYVYIYILFYIYYLLYIYIYIYVHY